MLIVCSKEGLLSNRLFHFSHLVSFAIENGETIWYPYIAEFAPLFCNLKSEILGKHGIVIYSSSIFNLILRIIGWLLRKIPENKYICSADGGGDLDLSLFQRKDRRLLFLSGWLLRDYASIRKHRELVKSIFQFDANTIDDCNAKLSLARRNNALLVGVHIRRGDYKEFQDGKFFFEVEIYREAIDQLRILFSSEGRDIAFIICTNDQGIHGSVLLNDSHIFHNRGSQLSDLCILSQCDYIIGPPSTFSAWASFYGAVPLTYIVKRNQVIGKSDFRVIEG